MKKMKLVATIFVTAALIAPAGFAQSSGSTSFTTCSTNAHLICRGNVPFLLLGDSPWEISTRTTRDDVAYYMSRRAAQGFTAVLLAAVEADLNDGPGVLGANRYGDTAFLGNNLATPDITPGNDPTDANQYDYWDHIDYMVQQAQQNGLAIVFFPIFTGNENTGLNYLTTSNAYTYGAFLGQRYGGIVNLMWVLGGDESADTQAEREVWRELARGITDGKVGFTDYTQTLMSYHPQAESVSSSTDLHNELWLDANGIETWVYIDQTVPRLANDYSLSPVKPTGIIESGYESAGTDPYGVRRQSHWTFMSGGAFHVYGSAMWDFNANWRNQLEMPGVTALGLLKALMLELNWSRLIPDRSVFLSGGGSGSTTHTAMRDNGSLLWVYFSSAATADIDLSKITTNAWVTPQWVNPTTGARITMPAAPNIHRIFTTPSGWTDADLVIRAGGTPSPNPDTTPPVITNMTANSIRRTRAIIQWNTDDLSDSVVEYGTTASYGNTASDPSLVNAHSVALSGMSRTTYHYRVRSTNTAGLTTVSGDQTFTPSK